MASATISFFMVSSSPGEVVMMNHLNKAVLI